MRRLLVFSAAAFLVACAHVEPRLADPGDRPAQVMVTGSRLPQPVDPSTGRARTTQPIRVYTMDDLARTGMSDLGQALLKATPSRP
ncbi:MAG: hypothetical protein NDI82_05490 [Anaeromyxobacteraceae bacterium]|nr:hypothetical protein [Anaeromyxobacteraceae bacterium]